MSEEKKKDEEMISPEQMENLIKGVMKKEKPETQGENSSDNDEEIEIDLE